MKDYNQMNALEILNEVAIDEKENNCSDRAKLTAQNLRLLHLTGKTAAALLDELGVE